MPARLLSKKLRSMLTIASAGSRKSEENEMSDFGQKQPDPDAEAPGSPDSPKPHGDKLANAVRAAAKGDQPDR